MSILINKLKNKLKNKIKLNKAPKIIWTNPIYITAFGFGSGASPIAPGTMGTVMGVILYLGLQKLNLFYYLLIIILGLIFGIWICDKTEKAIGVHDHSGIVWDEIIGYWITMIAAPKGWGWIITGFILFRLFDIWKPWPVRLIDKKCGGGLGVMLDDVMAGIYALVCMLLLSYFTY